MFYNYGDYSISLDFQGFINRKDFYFSNVELLLHCDGNSGSTVFVDNSVYSRSITVGGDAKISTTQAKFNESGLFDGSGDYLTVGDTTTFKWVHDKTEANYTIELWIRPESISGRRSLLETSAVSSESGFLLEINEGSIDFTIYRGVSGSFTHISGGNIFTGTWYHIAIVNDNNTLKLFIDGVLINSTSWSLSGSSSNSQRSLIVGADTIFSSVNDFTGYLDDIRITKGVARYTSNFTIPILPFPDS